MTPQVKAAQASVAKLWRDRVEPTLTEYIRIPNKSPHFDPDWEANGHMQRAVDLFAAWAREQAPPGATVEVVRLAGRTPVLLLEMPGATDETVLLYGHLDKQPEMEGWQEGLGPWTPVLRDDKLYGRGGADDGYALFACISALRVLQEQEIPHARCVVLIEACEESGSADLPAYMEHLAGRIGEPSLVVCLDSGCGNYEQLWTTTSLRGLLFGRLQVDILTEGVHSGDAGGVVPSSFRILRTLLDRLQDAGTGELLPRGLHAEIPEERKQQVKRAGSVLGSTFYERFPFVSGARPTHTEPAELMLNGTWRPALATVGADGLPGPALAGNVLRPTTSLLLVLRLPPTVSGHAALAEVTEVLEKEPPYGARVRFVDSGSADGWNAPPIASWLETALQEASQAYFGAEALYRGEGGSIPFMAMLGQRFPKAQFMISGVLGPRSNAHGPNEFLHLPTARRLSCCVAHVLAKHYQRV